jgi:hypothetical protein
MKDQNPNYQIIRINQTFLATGWTCSRPKFNTGIVKIGEVTQLNQSVEREFKLMSLQTKLHNVETN